MFHESILLKPRRLIHLYMFNQWTEYMPSHTYTSVHTFVYLPSACIGMCVFVERINSGSQQSDIKYFDLIVWAKTFVSVRVLNIFDYFRLVGYYPCVIVSLFDKNRLETCPSLHLPRNIARDWEIKSKVIKVAKILGSIGVVCDLTLTRSFRACWLGLIIQEGDRIRSISTVIVFPKIISRKCMCMGVVFVLYNWWIVLFGVEIADLFCFFIAAPSPKVVEIRRHHVWTLSYVTARKDRDYYAGANTGNIHKLIVLFE